MADTPEAAPVAPVTGTEEAPTTSQPTTEATTPAGAGTQGEATPVADIPADQIEAFNKFIKGQGGFENAFGLWKDSIAKGEQKAAQPAQQPAQPTQQPQQPVQQEQQPVSIPKGYISPRELMAQQYYSSLAAQPEYAAISDKISSGEMFNEMAKFGISPMDKDGNINDTQVREFLNLYAKTVPAAPAAEPQASNAPTVDYISVKDGKIDSIDQAARVIAQSSTLTARGMAPHPDLAAAEAFMKDALSGKKK